MSDKQQRADGTPAPDCSAFALWFEAQHGKRPGKDVSESDLLRARNEGLRADMLLRARSEYDARRQSALYAWQINDAEKSVNAVRGMIAPNGSGEGRP